MATSKRYFNGGMDLDSSPYRVGKDSYVMAMNINKDARNGDGDVQITGVVGNRLVNYTLPIGFNKVVAAKDDRLRNKVYFFVYNDGGYHSILQYDNATRVITKILESQTDSGGIDILGFNTTGCIQVDMLNRDEGDLMFFLDSTGRPREINITKALAGGYGIFTMQATKSLKEPPLLEPVAIYQDDVTATVNNLRKNLFQFRSQWVYDDFTESSWSAMSKVPLPAAYLAPATDPNPQKNSKIQITVNTGPAEVRKIRIAVRGNNGATFTDYYLIVTLDKTQDGIADNIDYNYTFKNDSTYNYIDVPESNLLFDWLPDVANAQAMINGNVLVYGGITEGHNRDCTPDIDVTSDFTVENTPSTEVVPVYNWSTKYGFCVAYYDENNKTPGGISTDAMRVTTVGYSENTPTSLNIPRIDFAINHVPPLWAKYMRFGRTKNLSQFEYLYWISVATQKDTKYAYLDISNLNQYIVDNPATAAVLGYSFSDGDRVRIIKRAVAGITQNVYTNKDYQLQGVVTDPLIGGVQKNGVFLKINIPTVDGTFDFGTPNFANYMVQIYRPAINVASGLDVFYEFGESYAILDPGTVARRHSGQIQDQVIGAAPALFEFTEGDSYLKSRSILTAKKIEYRIRPDGTAYDYHNVPVTFLGTNDLSSGYVAGGSVCDEGYTNKADRVILHANRTMALRAKGKINITFTSIKQYKLILTINNYGGAFDVVLIDGNTSTNYSIGAHQFEFDTTFNVPVNANVFMMASTRLDGNTGEGPTVTYGESFFDFYEDNAFVYKSPDESFADDFLSKVNSNGRPLTLDTDSVRSYNPNMIRFGGEYQQGTIVNKISRFFAANLDEYDRSFGDIMRLKVRDRSLRVFQKYKVGTVPILQQVIKDATGGDVLAQSDKLLNNIQYYNGEFGIGECPESLASNNFVDYFVDNNRGVICRLSIDGLTVISILYKVNSWATENLPLRGINSKAYGVFDAASNRYILALEPATGSAAQTISFHEPSNIFESFMQYLPEQLVCLNTLLISFYNGKLWTHDSDTYCNFYGVQYKPSVKAVYNEGDDFRKSFLCMNIVANKYWLATAIRTSLLQDSVLDVTGDWERTEDGYSGRFYRDQNSPGGLNAGDELKGNWITVDLEAETGDTLSAMVSTSVIFIESNKNPR